MSACGPATFSCPLSTYYALYPLEAALRRAKRREAEIVVLHVRMLRRAASGEYDLAPDQLFSNIEQLLFTKVLAIAEKEGKPVRLAVAAANDLWEGILRTAANLQSSSIVLGSSSKTQCHGTGARNRPRLGAHARTQAPRLAGSLFAFRPRAGFLSRPSRSAIDAQGNRSAAQSVARVQRQPPGR